MYQIKILSNLRAVLAFILENDLKCKMLTVFTSGHINFVIETTSSFDALTISVYCAENGIEFE